jgi:hypothetical protein
MVTLAMLLHFVYGIPRHPLLLYTNITAKNYAVALACHKKHRLPGRQGRTPTMGHDLDDKLKRIMKEEIGLDHTPGSKEVISTVCYSLTLFFTFIISPFHPGQTSCFDFTEK